MQLVKKSAWIEKTRIRREGIRFKKSPLILPSDKKLITPKSFYRVHNPCCCNEEVSNTGSGSGESDEVSEESDPFSGLSISESGEFSTVSPGTCGGCGSGVPIPLRFTISNAGDTNLMGTCGGDDVDRGGPCRLLAGLTLNGPGLGLCQWSSVNLTDDTGVYNPFSSPCFHCPGTITVTLSLETGIFQVRLTTSAPPFGCGTDTAMQFTSTDFSCIGGGTFNYSAGGIIPCLAGSSVSITPGG